MRDGPGCNRPAPWLGLLRCRACGRRMTGHVERYRHVDACVAFRNARPQTADHRGLGDSYKVGVYDRIAAQALRHVVANAAPTAEIESAVAERNQPVPDQFTLARIRPGRQHATHRLAADLDLRPWQPAVRRSGP